MSETGIGPTHGRRNIRMRHGETAHVQLINDLTVPVECRAVRHWQDRRRTNDRLGHQRGGVLRPRPAAVEQQRIQPERPVDLRRPRVHQQLGRIEPQAVSRIPPSISAQPIARSRRDPANMPMKHRPGAPRQPEPARLPVIRVEQAHRDRVRVRRVHRDVDPIPRERHAQRVRRSGTHPAHGRSASSDWNSAIYRRAERRHDMSAAMPLRWVRSQAALSRHSASSRGSTASSASAVGGQN